MVERASGRLVGEAGLQVLEAGPDVELTYTLARDAWGRGYATEAGARVLRWAFAGLRLPRSSPWRTRTTARRCACSTSWA